MGGMLEEISYDHGTWEGGTRGLQELVARWDLDPGLLRARIAAAAEDLTLYYGNARRRHHGSARGAPARHAA